METLPHVFIIQSHPHLFVKQVNVLSVQSFLLSKLIYVIFVYVSPPCVTLALRMRGYLMIYFWWFNLSVFYYQGGVRLVFSLLDDKEGRSKRYNQISTCGHGRGALQPKLRTKQVSMMSLLLIQDTDVFTNSSFSSSVKTLPVVFLLLVKNFLE